ncbi:MAG: hypothetical protein IJ449_12680 [Clostridia bacterium]|nr:hypothetical protein [Clostridia bacterium]
MKQWTYRKTLGIALLAAMLCASCGDNAGADTSAGGAVTGTETGAETETAAVIETERVAAPDDLPDVSYEGETFTVLYRGAGATYAVTDVIIEETNGEIVNDSAFERNAKLEEKYGITLAGIEKEEPSELAKQEIMSGSSSFDIMTDKMTILNTLAVEGYLCDWYSLDCFDPADAWWDENAAEGLSIGGQLYMMVSDISMNASSRARYLYINKKIAANYDLTVPYDLVREGKWTFDRLNEMICAVSSDLNGDGVMDGEDLYGMLTENSKFFLSGCGIIFTEKDADDLPYLSFINDRSVSVLTDVKALLDNKKNTLSYEEAAKGKDTSDFAHIYDYGRALFASDHFLFVQNGANVASQFSDMTSEYGIVPNPKYDEAQPDYYHLMDEHACAWAIPTTNTNPEKTDIIMNWWGYLSSNTLVDAFYETTIKYKRLNAPEDAEMLDIVRGSVRYEIATIADLGVMDVLNSAFTSGNLMSSYEKKSKTIEKKFEKLIAAYTESAE